MVSVRDDAIAVGPDDGWGGVRVASVCDDASAVAPDDGWGTGL